MGINGMNNLNQYAIAQMGKVPAANQTKTAAVAASKSAGIVKSGKQTDKPPAFHDIAGRIGSISDLEQYEDVIKRFLSGESEMESADKPLTEDQIALRVLMREYRRTDTRTISQIQGSMQLANKNFFNYWTSNGNTGPMPGRVICADGSFKIFNSKAEKDEYMKSQKMDFLRTVMSVINDKKSGDTPDMKGFDTLI